MPAPGDRGVPEKSLARSLGEFVGHIAAAIRAEPSSSDRREVSRTVEERTVDTPRGTTTLRRTVIEEIELPAAPDR
jgi:hypothetical protein